MTEILNYPKCYKHTLTGHGEYPGSYRHLSQQQQELQPRMFNGMQNAISQRSHSNSELNNFGGGNLEMYFV